MKIVLGRKGFDSGWGGNPSPILPEGRLVSLPIPDLDGIRGFDRQLPAELAGVAQARRQDTEAADPDRARLADRQRLVVDRVRGDPGEHVTRPRAPQPDHGPRVGSILDGHPIDDRDRPRVLRRSWHCLGGRLAGPHRW